MISTLAVGAETRQESGARSAHASPPRISIARGRRGRGWARQDDGHLGASVLQDLGDAEGLADTLRRPHRVGPPAQDPGAELAFVVRPRDDPVGRPDGWLAWKRPRQQHDLGVGPIRGSAHHGAEHRSARRGLRARCRRQHGGAHHAEQWRSKLHPASGAEWSSGTPAPFWRGKRHQGITRQRPPQVLAAARRRGSRSPPWQRSEPVALQSHPGRIRSKHHRKGLPGDMTTRSDWRAAGASARTRSRGGRA